MKMGCVVREPLHCFASQPRETAIFEGEPSNGHGVYSIEIRHQERFNVKEDQLVDFTNEMHPGGALDLKRPRR
jgi:hypothetical protein